MNLKEIAEDRGGYYYYYSDTNSFVWVDWTGSREDEFLGEEELYYLDPEELEWVDRELGENEVTWGTEEFVSDNTREQGGYERIFV